MVVADGWQMIKNAVRPGRTEKMILNDAMDGFIKSLTP